MLATSSDLIEGEPLSPTTNSSPIVDFALVVSTEDIPSSSHTPLPIVSVLIPSSEPELATILYTLPTIGSQTGSNFWSTSTVKLPSPDTPNK